MKPAAYEGSEPYIFVSYAHKDTDRVFQVLDELYPKGYRIWYDEGITPGSEWPEEVAQHLYNSSLLLAFISANSLKSENCRREIHFALSIGKPFLSVVLEKTEIPLGMQMQLSSHQSILRYNFETWEGFIEKILKCPGLKPCKEEGMASKEARADSGSGQTDYSTLKKEINEDRLQYVISKANEYHNNNDYNHELQTWLSGLAIDPNNLTVLLGTGRVYRTMGYHEKALEYYEKAKNVAPNNPFVYLNTGIAYSDSDRNTQAIPYYKKAIRIFEENASSYSPQNLGVCYGNYAFCIGKTGDANEAKKYLRLAKENGYSEESIKTICQFLKIDPNDLTDQGIPNTDISGLLIKAKEYHDKENYLQELETLLAALRIVPDHTDALIRAGRAYRILGDNKMALAYYEKAKAIDPNVPTIYMNIATVRYLSGDYTSAKSSFEQALRLISENPSSISLQDEAVCCGNYAMCIGTLGDIEGAKEYLKKAKAKGYSESSIRTICERLKIDPASLG